MIQSTQSAGAVHDIWVLVEPLIIIVLVGGVGSPVRTKTIKTLHWAEPKTYPVCR